MIMEGDAQVLINAINEAEECRAWFGNLIEDAKMRLKSLPLWKVRFIHREGNRVAHYLAKHGLLLNCESIWIDEYPDVIAHFVLQDLID